MHTTPSAFTDMLYCMIDTFRIEEEDRPKIEVINNLGQIYSYILDPAEWF